MFGTVLKWLFLLGLVAQEVIRAPYRVGNKQARRSGDISVNRLTLAEGLLMTLGFVGLQLLPVIYVLTGWPAFADYSCLPWIGAVGVPIMAFALWLLWRSHHDLGRNFSPTLEMVHDHRLVTDGVYRYLRHPLYASLWLVTLAQALMLPNWIAGLAGIVSFLPIFFMRVPREEEMMLSYFGEEYRAYMARTGGIIPRLKGTVR